MIDLYNTGLIASKMAVEDAGLMTLDDKSKLRVGVSVGFRNRRFRNNL